MIRISGKTLAELNLPNTCPACFKIKVRLSQQGSLEGKSLPFQTPMPGVFSNLDSHVKQVVKHYFKAHGKMPSWFPDLGQKIIAIEETPGWQNFNVVYPQYGIKLTGALDTVFKLEDGSYLLADYKTARLTETHDNLLPLYHAQLQAYLDIAKRLSLFHPVSALALIYTEPIDFKVEDNYYQIADFEKNFHLHFRVVPRLLAVKESLTETLLQRALEIMGSDSGPNPENCINCQLRDRLFQEENFWRKSGALSRPDSERVPF